MTEAYIVAYGRSPICKGKEEELTITVNLKKLLLRCLEGS